jgi:hypothetical protein
MEVGDLCLPSGKWAWMYLCMYFLDSKEDLGIGRFGIIGVFYFRIVANNCYCCCVSVNSAILYWFELLCIIVGDDLPI